MKTIVCEAYIKKDGKILMVQENRESKKEKWNMPAGKLEENESIIDSCIREVKKETNVNIEVTGLITIEEKINDVKWMNEEDIKSIDKDSIRGGESINDIFELAKNSISLDRIKIEKVV